MRWPLDSFTVTQTFNNPAGHGGLDLAAPENTPIYSPVSGVVVGDGENAYYLGGKYVIVRDDVGSRMEFYMGHMTSNVVTNGEHVTEGQHIGNVGHTGKATGPHVHFQIRSFGGGALIDPELVYKSQGDDMTITDRAMLEKEWAGFLDRPPMDSEYKEFVGKPLESVLDTVWKSPEFKNRMDGLRKAYYENLDLKAENVKLRKQVAEGTGEFEPVTVYRKK